MVISCDKIIMMHTLKMPTKDVSIRRYINRSVIIEYFYFIKYDKSYMHYRDDLN